MKKFSPVQFSEIKTQTTVDGAIAELNRVANSTPMGKVNVRELAKILGLEGNEKGQVVPRTAEDTVKLYEQLDAKLKDMEMQDRKAVDAKAKGGVMGFLKSIFKKPESKAMVSEKAGYLESYFTNQMNDLADNSHEHKLEAKKEDEYLEKVAEAKEVAEERAAAKAKTIARNEAKSIKSDSKDKSSVVSDSSSVSIENEANEAGYEALNEAPKKESIAQIPGIEEVTATLKGKASKQEDRVAHPPQRARDSSSEISR